jgi:hypothetical protein
VVGWPPLSARPTDPNPTLSAIISANKIKQVVPATVSSWVLYDSSGPVPRRVAEGVESGEPIVYDRAVWAAAQEQARG